VGLGELADLQRKTNSGQAPTPPFANRMTSGWDCWLIFRAVGVVAECHSTAHFTAHLIDYSIAVIP